MAKLLASLFALLGLSLMPQSAAQTVPVPPEFQDLYTTLNTNILLFNNTLNLLGNGSPSNSLPTGDLAVANSNTGPRLVGPRYFTNTVQNQLTSLRALGIKAVMVQVSFPILYEPFYSSQSEYQQYVTFYSQVATAVRAAGLKLIVESQCVSEGLAQSGWNPAPFYATLNWTQYQAARAQSAATTAQVMQPDYMIVMEEPDSESTMSGQTNVDTVSGATSMLNQILASVRAANVPNMKVGAGVGSWLRGFQGFIYSYTQQFCSASQPCINAPLDFIDTHVFPINLWGPPGNNNYLANALTIANIAAAAGLPFSIAECWEWKARNSEYNVLSADQIMSRNVFSFWAPVDAYFLQTMQRLSNYTRMLFMSPFDSAYYWGYLTYDSATQNLTPSELFAQSAAQSALNMRQAIYTRTAMSYYAQNVSPPDTTPPTAPGNLAAISKTPTGASLTWTPASDEVGVAGYYVTRDGVQIGSTLLPYYVDSNLTQNTTYTYQVAAFDLGKNVSPYVSATATTRNGSPPNPPTNLTGAAVSPVQVSMSWTPPTGNAVISSYLIFRGSSPTKLAQFAQLTGTSTSYNNYQLTPGTTYYYGLEAVSNGYTSPMSNVVAITTMAPPTAPSNLAVTPSSSVKMLVNWSASSSGVGILDYYIYRGTSSSNLSQAAVRAATSYIDLTVTPGTLYYYAVQAKDTTGTLSPMSNIVSATAPVLPTTPGNVSAAVVSSSKVTVSWSASTGGLPIARYQLYRGGSPSNLSPLAVRLGTPYTDSGLNPGTEYYYAVQAIDTAGDVSPISGAVSVVTPTLPPH